MLRALSALRNFDMSGNSFPNVCWATPGRSVVAAIASLPLVSLNMSMCILVRAALGEIAGKEACMYMHRYPGETAVQAAALINSLFGTLFGTLASVGVSQTSIHSGRLAVVHEACVFWQVLGLRPLLR